MQIAVLCIGNELMMDEGFGPSCARYLKSRYAFPANVDVLDRAVMGMAIISDMRRYDYLLVLDALQIPDEEPGRMFSFAPEDIAPTPPGMISLHEVRFADVLGSAELLGISCQGHCMGVQVENMSPSEFIMALTPRVAAAVPLMCQAAVRWLRTELSCEITDLIDQKDPLAAGTCVPESRDFSEAGIRPKTPRKNAPATSGLTTGTAPDRLTADASDPASSPLVLPEIYGEPDTSVMTRYLMQGLAAVGAQGSVCSATPQVVEFRLPQSDAMDLSERFGFEVSVADGTSGNMSTGVVAESSETTDKGCPCRAWVHPATTDYDCDALIGACRSAWAAHASAR